MTPSNLRMNRRSIRAPQEPNTSLVEPSFFSLGQVVKDNRERHCRSDVDVGGISLVELSEKARESLYECALRHTGQYRDVSGFDASRFRGNPSSKLILSGHQPQLFHPGVWFKNVALSQWSRQQRATGIQLIIDSDLCRNNSIRVPNGSMESPSTVNIPFDETAAAVPFEERRIVNAETFCSFDQRTLAAIKPLVPNPIVNRLWPSARDAHKSNTNLGQVLAQARHTYEQSWGLETLEVPWSNVCDSQPFRHFTVAILQRIDEFRAVYNEVLREYRRINKVRGQSRPVAELSSANGWIETPFWCWTEDSPQRHPLFVRTIDGGLELRSQNAQVSTIQLCDDIHKATEQLFDARKKGFKVRSRALVTTMYARLFLCDVFIHGIGGAKYDELTDEIVHRFWKHQPPQYFTLSATVPLPISRPVADKDDLRRIDGLLRDMWYHPENHVDSTDGSNDVGKFPVSDFRPLRDLTVITNTKLLTQEKRHWINNAPAPGKAKQRHDGIVSTTARLREHVSSKRDALLDERRHLAQQLRHSAILSSREYSFCLFPENRLRRTLLDLLL